MCEKEIEREEEVVSETGQRERRKRETERGRKEEVSERGSEKNS